MRIFLGANPQTPRPPTRNSYKTNIVNIFSLEESLKIKVYPCGGTYICIDVPSEEALPPLPYFRAGVHDREYRSVTSRKLFFQNILILALDPEKAL